MLKVEAIPTLRDNYVWVLHDGHAAVFVDPGEAGPILTWLARHGDAAPTPATLLLTHHHADHVGGVGELLRHWRLPVFGPAGIAGVDHPLGGGERLHLPGLGREAEVIAVPGHTLDHLAYLIDGHLFCGDTLFSAGCGRLFEGSPAQMQASLARLAALPDATRIHCAHEYTLANLQFAAWVDPDNAALLAWQDAARALRRAGRPTLPTRLADERAYNPFLRCADPEFRRRLAAHLGCRLDDAVETLRVLREAKNNFS